MGSLTNYAENKWLNHVLKGIAFSQPASLYLVLSTADPLEDGSGLAEPLGNGYARAACSTSFGVASLRAISNNVDIVFPQASGLWGTITHFAIMDSTTGGNMLAYGTLTIQKTVTTGVTPKVPTGTLIISVNAGAWSTDGANRMLDHTFKKTAFVQPANLYIGLSTINPGDSFSAIAEPTGNGYSRVNFNTWTIINSAAENNGVVTFPTATGVWGTITHHFISTELAGGIYLYYGALDITQIIDIDDVVTYASGAFDITQD